MTHAVLGITSQRDIIFSRSGSGLRWMITKQTTNTTRTFSFLVWSSISSQTHIAKLQLRFLIFLTMLIKTHNWPWQWLSPCPQLRSRCLQSRCRCPGDPWSHQRISADLPGPGPDHQAEAHPPCSRRGWGLAHRFPGVNWKLMRKFLWMYICPHQTH